MKALGRGRLTSGLLALWCVTGAAGCVTGTGVQRVYDGNVVVGRFVSPEAYAAYLRGALAQADGHLDEALQAYEEAAGRQPYSPEVWARMGEVRCKQAPRDPQADEDFRHALSLDARYAPAWSARGACALSRGNAADARAFAQRAADLDPGADGANVLLARTAPGPGDAATRARLVALTATARDPVVAWETLATWAERAGDVSLWAQALRELAGRAPDRREAVARGAVVLAGIGALGDARSVAAAALDASDAPLPPGHALTTRLALDEAIARRDGVALRVRSTRGRVTLEEAAARALLGGERELARELAAEVTRADPAARGARLVLAASGGGDLLTLARESGPTDGRDAPVTAAALMAVGVVLSRSVPASTARAALDAIRRGTTEAIVSGDDPVARPAVELVSRSLLDPALLPVDAAVELAALHGQPAATLQGLDPRHEYLALALQRSDAPRAHELARRLSQVASTDSVVAAAAGLVQLDSGAAIAPEAPALLLGRNASDPLLAAIALRLAERVGDHEVATRAQRVLTALGTAGPIKTE